jgi:hypothetical protein
LVEGAYQPVEIQEMGPAHRHGHSDVLGLDLCWDNGTLRLRDPSTGKFLPNPRELRSELDASQTRVAELEAELRRLRGD